MPLYPGGQGRGQPPVWVCWLQTRTGKTRCRGHGRRGTCSSGLRSAGGCSPRPRSARRQVPWAAPGPLLAQPLPALPASASPSVPLSPEASLGPATAWRNPSLGLIRSRVSRRLLCSERAPGLIVAPAGVRAGQQNGVQPGTAALHTSLDFGAGAASSANVQMGEVRDAPRKACLSFALLADIESSRCLGGARAWPQG